MSKIRIFASNSEVEKWPMKLWFIAKEVEDIVGARGSSQNHVGKSAGMLDEGRKELDLKESGMIQLCLANEIMYNVMGEEMASGLWSMLEILYITKSLSNKLYLNK